MKLDEKIDAYKKAHNDALNSIDPIREFHEIYPDAISSFSRFSGEVGDPIWKSKAFLYDRYILMMQVPVELSRNRERVVKAMEPDYHLLEVVRMENLGQNRFSQRFGQSWRFGPDKWEELKDAEGRIDLVFPDISANSPVPLFKNGEEHERWLHSGWQGGN